MANMLIVNNFLACSAINHCKAICHLVTQVCYGLGGACVYLYFQVIVESVILENLFILQYSQTQIIYYVVKKLYN